MWVCHCAAVSDAATIGDADADVGASLCLFAVIAFNNLAAASRAMRQPAKRARRSDDGTGDAVGTGSATAAAGAPRPALPPTPGARSGGGAGGGGGAGVGPSDDDVFLRSIVADTRYFRVAAYASVDRTLSTPRLSTQYPMLASVLLRFHASQSQLLRAYERFSSSAAVGAGSSGGAGGAGTGPALPDPPDDFVDPISCELMVDPVLLPTSKTVRDALAWQYACVSVCLCVCDGLAMLSCLQVCDRSTITRALLNDELVRGWVPPCPGPSCTHRRVFISVKSLSLLSFL
jgi:hypothetical protein